MEQIISQLRTVLDAILKIKGSLVVEQGKVDNVSRHQDNVAEIQSEKQVELEKREEAVKPIEDVVAFKKAAEVMAKEVNEGRISLDKAQEAFQGFKNVELDKLAAKKKIVADLEAEHKRELAALKIAREDIEK